MTKLYVALYQEHTASLRDSVKHMTEDGYDLLVTPIVNGSNRRTFDDPTLSIRHTVFTRSDLILEAAEWHGKIVAKISETIDCDSACPRIRKHSERTLMQELSFAEHLMNCYVLIKLRAGPSVNLARTVARHIKGAILMEVPMVDPKSLALDWRRRGVDDATTIDGDDGDDNKAVATGEDTWTWWNRFRMCADFDSKIFIALELSADIPSEAELKRWLGEPVSQIIVPSNVFIRNAKNYPVLSKAHQAVLVAFMRNNCGFIVKCNGEDGSVRHYSEYLRHLCEISGKRDPMQGFDDFLEIPLQPLYDNLDAYTYEVFEKDPVKYLYYQRAIEGALMDKVAEADVATKTVSTCTFLWRVCTYNILHLIFCKKTDGSNGCRCRTWPPGSGRH